MCMCVYVYVCIYIYIYIYTPIHMYSRCAHRVYFFVNDDMGWNYDAPTPLLRLSLLRLLGSNLPGKFPLY